MKVFVKNFQGRRVLTYTYKAGPEVEFRFHLLSEVGAPWQGQARQMAQALVPAGRHIESVELDAKPWFVDAIIKDN